MLVNGENYSRLHQMKTTPENVSGRQSRVWQGGANMEKFTLELEDMLEKKLSLYRRLNELLDKEKAFIIDMNIPALWKSAEEKKQTANDIFELRKQLLHWFENCFRPSDMSEQTFSLAHLIRSLPMPDVDKQGLRKKKLAINREKELLNQSGVENRNYVSEYLSVIDEIMGVVADNSRQAGYNQSGRVAGEKTPNRLIHAEV